jgi:hypothetical protein
MSTAGSSSHRRRLVRRRARVACHPASRAAERFDNLGAAAGDPDRSVGNPRRREIVLYTGSRHSVTDSPGCRKVPTATRRSSSGAWERIAPSPLLGTPTSSTAVRRLEQSAADRRVRRREVRSAESRRPVPSAHTIRRRHEGPSVRRRAEFIGRTPETRANAIAGTPGRSSGRSGGGRRARGARVYLRPLDARPDHLRLLAAEGSHRSEGDQRHPQSPRARARRPGERSCVGASCPAHHLATSHRCRCSANGKRRGARWVSRSRRTRPGGR